MRTVILGVALLLIGILAFGAIRDIGANGLNPIAVLAIVVLALFAFGVVGALRNPPRA